MWNSPSTGLGRIQEEDAAERQLDDQHKDAAEDAEFIETGAEGHADGRGGPDAGSRRQALDDVMTDKDDARTEKADAGDNLGGNPCRIFIAGFKKAVLRDNHQQCRTHGHNGMCTDAGIFGTGMTFIADACTHNRGAENSQKPFY